MTDLFSTQQARFSLNYVWSVALLDWIEEQQPIISGATVVIAQPVAVTVSDGADTAEGSKADSRATNSTSSWSVIALLKGLYALLAGTLTITGEVAVDQNNAVGLSGGWPVKVTDGTSILGTPTAPIRNDPTGTTQQPVSQGNAANMAGSWPVEMTDGTNILGTSTHPVRVDPTGTTTQPVSGTVTANAGTGPFPVEEALNTTQRTTPVKISINTSGDNTIVAGVGGQTVRVHKIAIAAASSVAVTFKDGTTALTGAMTLGTLVFDFDAEPWFITSSGNAFVINLGAAIQVSGVAYVSQS